MNLEGLISFETAKLAEEKGFKKLCDFSYDEDGILTGNCEQSYNYVAPTQSLLQKWLREEHHLIVIVAYQYEHDSTPYSYWIYKENNSLPLNQWINDLKTYEEALELGLEKALNLIK